MRRRPGARSGSRGDATAATLAREAPAVLLRPLPVLLVDAAGLENQRALAAYRLAATGSEHDAGADAYSAAASAADPEADRRASPGARAFGHPGIHVAAVRELGAARGRPPAQHDLIVRGSVPACRGFADSARGGAAGKQNYDQRCDSHKASMETKTPRRFLPGAPSCCKARRPNGWRISQVGLIRCSRSVVRSCLVDLSRDHLLSKLWDFSLSRSLGPATRVRRSRRARPVRAGSGATARCRGGSRDRTPERAG